MNQVPHITDQNCTDAFKALQDNGFYSIANLCNKAIEIALAEQSQEQPLISAEEARKLGVGNCLCLDADGQWRVTTDKCKFPKWRGTSEIKYLAIKQPEQTTGCACKFVGDLNTSRCELHEAWFVALHEWAERAKTAEAKQPEPVEPHAELRAMYEQQVKDGTLDNFVWESKYLDVASQWTEPISPQWRKYMEYRCTPKPTCRVRNEDTGELKTLTREAAKKLQAETNGTHGWFNASGMPFSPDYNYRFDGAGIYTYKQKANLVKLNGKLVTREAAIAEWESKKDTHDGFYKSDTTGGEFGYCPSMYGNPYSHKNAEYELRERMMVTIVPPELTLESLDARLKVLEAK